MKFSLLTVTSAALLTAIVGCGSNAADDKEGTVSSNLDESFGGSFADYRSLCWQVGRYTEILNNIEGYGLQSLNEAANYWVPQNPSDYAGSLNSAECVDDSQVVDMQTFWGEPRWPSQTRDLQLNAIRTNRWDSPSAMYGHVSVSRTNGAIDNSMAAVSFGGDGVNTFSVQKVGNQAGLNSQESLANIIGMIQRDRSRWTFQGMPITDKIINDMSNSADLYVTAISSRSVFTEVFERLANGKFGFVAVRNQTGKYRTRTGNILVYSVPAKLMSQNAYPPAIPYKLTLPWDI